MEKYVCAFRGRRDNYQVPLALAERDLLDQFITDFYAAELTQKLVPILPEKWGQKLSFRYEPEIPNSKVKCLWGTTLVEHTRHRLGFSKPATFAQLDKNFSKAAISRTKLTKSNLFLYEPYAWEAFTSVYRHDLKKVLFHYHPHTDVERRILTEDVASYPMVKSSYQETVGEKVSPELITRVKDSWKYADTILCASSFTLSTLIEAGADPNICKVISYGIDLPNKLTISNPTTFQPLFVGYGVQRKGLHHLILAWQRANLPPDSKLTLVCRFLDPGIDKLIQETPNVKLFRGVNRETLYHLYTKSSLLVMPSLIEGFGQVFLEALSYGCPVLGTVNTCLPDLGTESDGIFIAEVGNLDQLVDRLEYLAVTLPQNPVLRKNAYSLAAKFSWNNFRATLSSYL
ncbi:glycosyltransferase family 4 protein [Chrysosporum ovalisporum APH033B]|uniref:glycosyltransferase family 4 protein n=1 Tax=Umezakia ovalisporum TaxID=75695 RepID=UPI0024759279|nr:glycosyltransferase family 4 protein [Umezakia ovalisporum]MDH6067821.1 glycosyltransferase family 4 protein [Umezakia ovalisporum APH033B]